MTTADEVFIYWIQLPAMKCNGVKFENLSTHLNLERHLYSRKNFKENRKAALAEWRQLLAA